MPALRLGPYQAHAMAHRRYRRVGASVWTPNPEPMMTAFQKGFMYAGCTLNILGCILLEADNDVCEIGAWLLLAFIVCYEVPLEKPEDDL